MIIKSEFVDISTPTGLMRTYIYRPDNDACYPAIIYYSEIFLMEKVTVLKIG